MEEFPDVEKADEWDALDDHRSNRLGLVEEREDHSMPAQQRDVKRQGSETPELAGAQVDPGLEPNQDGRDEGAAESMSSSDAERKAAANVSSLNYDEEVDYDEAQGVINDKKSCGNEMTWMGGHVHMWPGTLCCSCTPAPLFCCEVTSVCRRVDSFRDRARRSSRHG